MFRSVLSGLRQPYCLNDTYMEHKGSQYLTEMAGKEENSQAVEDYKSIYET